MRGDEGVLRGPQRVASGKRFGIDDVDGALQAAGHDFPGQGLGAHHGAAAHVHHQGAVGQGGQDFLATR